jgi:hypothetical protein
MDWRDVEMEIDAAGAVRALLSNGAQTVEFVANFELGDRWVALRGLHVYGAGPNSLGIAGLRELIRWAKEQLDVDELRIEGATRTSGASPGRRPAPLVFR